MTDMLVITLAQKHVFEAAAVRRFAIRLREVLGRRYPDLLSAPDQPAVLAMIEARCISASRYGLSSEVAIGDFVDLCLQLGARFQHHPDVADILSDAEIPPDERMSALMSRLPPSAWRDIRRYAAGQ